MKSNLHSTHPASSFLLTLVVGGVMLTQPHFATTAETSQAGAVTFQSSDPELQQLHDSAIDKIQRHLIEYAPGVRVLVNSGDYTGLFLENAVLNAESYARFDPAPGIANMQVHFFTQREDGKFPNVVWPGYRMRETNRKPGEFTPVIPELDGAIANYTGINGICFPYHAWRLYFWAGEDRDYLEQLYTALETYDAYLWKTRDSDGDGLLELWCIYDTAEDYATRLMTRYAPSHWPYEIPPGASGAPVPTDPDSFRRYWANHNRAGHSPPASTDEVLVPFESMDVNAYSHAARDVLALVSAELGNGKAEHWKAKAAEVRALIRDRLWVEEELACFDLDRHGRRNPELIHNNLRVMYYGGFSQEMADAFIRHHLLDPEKFWTSPPIPSIAINEPLFENVSGNNWGGQVQTLTLSRSLYGLERYGHYAEISLLGEQLIETWVKNDYCYSQQVDPFTGLNSGKIPDGNFTMTSTCLAYLPRMFGIYPIVDQEKIWWSALAREGNELRTTQRRGETAYELVIEAGRMTGHVNGEPVFSCNEGVRVVTDEAGSVVQVIGFSPEPVTRDLRIGDTTIRGEVKPNTVHEVDDGGLIRVSAVPFDYPYEESR